MINGICNVCGMDGTGCECWKESAKNRKAAMEDNNNTYIEIGKTISYNFSGQNSFNVSNEFKERLYNSGLIAERVRWAKDRYSIIVPATWEDVADSLLPGVD